MSGFIVAALAGGSFRGVIGAGFFIASMFFAGLVLQTKGLSVFIIFGIYGIILTGIAIGEVIGRYRLVKAMAPSSPTDDPTLGSAAAT